MVITYAIRGIDQRRIYSFMSYTNLICKLILRMVSHKKISKFEDTGVMSGAAIYLKEDLKISDVEIEILVGTINIYSLIGAAVAGRTSDWIGRRYTIIFASAFFFIGALLMAIAANYALLMVGRFVAGVGMGYALMIAPVYAAEVSPEVFRGSLTTFPEVFVNVGMEFYVNLNLFALNFSSFLWDKDHFW